MKWAAVIFAAMLYLIWPYYTLIELGSAIRSGDVKTINQLVDWDHVRSSVKHQISERLNNLPQTARQRELAKKNPEFAAAGNTLALSFANTLVDRVLTPKGIARLINGSRRRYHVAHGVRQANTLTSRRHYARHHARRHDSLWRRISFAFFISPIHFRLDLSESALAGWSGRSRHRPTLTVLLMFKGTGWQVWDLRLSGLGMSPKLAFAPR